MRKFSDIFESNFFVHKYGHVSRAQLEGYISLWASIQPLVTLGFLRLIGAEAEELAQRIIHGGDPKEIDAIKNIIHFQVPAAVDEIGLGRDKHGLFHHDLFTKQIEMCGLPSPKWVSTPLAVLLQQCFTSLHSGVSMMYLIETIAQALFEKQREIFLAAGYSEEHLPYTTLHAELEGEHGDEAQQYQVYTNPALLENYEQEWILFLNHCYKQLTS